MTLHVIERSSKKPGNEVGRKWINFLSQKLIKINRIFLEFAEVKTLF